MNHTLNPQEGRCPHCDNKMATISPHHYYCEQCQQNYIEQFICPTCQKPAQFIQGCGTAHYLCLDDGLISSKKIIIHYLPE